MNSSLNQWSWETGPFGSFVFGTRWSNWSIYIPVILYLSGGFSITRGSCPCLKMGSLKPGQFKKGTCWFNPLEIGDTLFSYKTLCFFPPRGDLIRGVPRFVCWTMCRNAIYLGWQFPWNMAVKSARDASTFVVGNRCPTGGCVDPQSPQIKMIFSLQDGATHL